MKGPTSPGSISPRRGTIGPNRRAKTAKSRGRHHANDSSPWVSGFWRVSSMLGTRSSDVVRMRTQYGGPPGHPQPAPIGPDIPWLNVAVRRAEQGVDVDFIKAGDPPYPWDCSRLKGHDL